MDDRRGRVTRWVEIPCPLCGSGESDPVYVREHEAGSALGRIRKVEVICRACGFMFSNPRPSAEDMRRHYAEASSGSGDVFHSLQPGSRRDLLTAERVRFVERMLTGRDLALGGTIFDVGCSNGDLLAGLDLAGWQKSALEPSPRAAARARSRGLEVGVGEIESSALPVDAFDVVTCISVLEHVWNVSAALEKIARALRPTGVAILEVPDSTRPIAQVAEFYSFEHLSHFTQGSLVRAIRRAGLEPFAFDESVGIPNLRVAARRRDAAIVGESLAAVDDRAELLTAVRRYAEERRALEQGLVDRLSRRAESWRERGARVGIFGAGTHTRFLMDLCDLAPAVTCLLDSDPGKWGSSFLDWRVHGPQEIPDLALDAILISSNAFEDEIHASIAAIAERRGIEVVRCYG